MNQNGTYNGLDGGINNGLYNGMDVGGLNGTTSGEKPLLLYVPPFDIFPTAAAAYSLRRLKTSYTGTAIRVRRLFDSAELNIGFSGNDLDTSELLSFIGTDSGFVTTWYDQTGNGRNLVQATTTSQPRIVANGVLEMYQNKPAIYFDNTDDRLVISSGTNILANINNAFVFSVAQKLSVSAGRVVGGYTSVGGSTVRMTSDFSDSQNFSLSGRRLNADSASGLASFRTYALFNAYLITAWFNWENSSLYLYVNGKLDSFTGSFQTAGSTSNTNGNLEIGANASLQVPLDGKVLEVLVYNNNQSLIRAGLETNIINYYKLY